MLNSSRLLSFLDQKREFSLQFLEGQKLIHDLVLLHPLKAQGFNFFRQTVLSFMPMIKYLKHGESLGIYLDSEKPYFRFKIETNFAGHTRTLLLPEDFQEVPAHITGNVRLTKLFTNNTSPYTSLFQFNEATPEEIINHILEHSYQIKSLVHVSELADQSFFINRLPKFNVDQIQENTDLKDLEFIKNLKEKFTPIFQAGYNDVENLVKNIEALGFIYLSSQTVELFCPCTREKMLYNLMGLNLMSDDGNDDLFDENQMLELKCDYCKKTYQIHKSELQKI
jgi:molecular chaperone Hsp33